MKANKTSFGKNGTMPIELFELQNNKGMIVKITNYGATITSISIPEKNSDKRKELVCGFDDFEDYFSDEYVNNAPYFGCTVGRYCSQIKDAKFTLDGIEYQLAKNCGENNLHGGIKGFDKKVWTAKVIYNDDAVGVKMSSVSEDMEEGFPGEVEVSVLFLLTNDNELKIQYEGIPSKTTPLSMTNHSYFNLSGFSEDILGHKATIYASKKQETDETGAATGKILSIDGAVDDLRAGKLIGEVQEVQGGGFENFYITDTNFDLKKVAEIEHNKSNTKLEILTTEPCMLFYTGIYTSNKLKRNDTEKYGQFRAFCCETHRYQNGPNIPGAPGTYTKSGKKFTSATIFKLIF